MDADLNKLQKLACAEIDATIKALPGPLRKEAEMLPVTLEETPGADLLVDGIEGDTMGLFVGAEFADEGVTVIPAQIILFLGNIWDVADGDEKIFCDEVRTTFLHELGHFLGLDEEDLTRRGLE